MKSRGFSLIELLVVVAILGIISALAVPVGQRMIQKAHRAKMLTQLRTLGDDQIMYHRDHGTFYPAGRQSGNRVFVFQLYRPEQAIPLEGRQDTMVGSPSRYAYYILRFEPFYPEPLIYAYAHRFFGNDLDGDAYPDMWIKVGSSPPQLYMDDFTNTRHSINLR